MLGTQGRRMHEVHGYQQDSVRGLVDAAGSGDNRRLENCSKCHPGCSLRWEGQKLRTQQQISRKAMGQRIVFHRWGHRQK